MHGKIASMTWTLMNLSGHRFGRLTVLEQDLSLGRRPTRWRCSCDCGGQKIVAAGELRKGSTNSCGCLSAELSSQRNSHDLTGKRFGRLLVQTRSGSSRYGVIWACLCDCGTMASALATKLRGGLVISCGCAASDKPGLLPMGTLIVMAAHNHKRRAQARAAGGSFTADQITILYARQRGRCAWCQASLKTGFHRDHRVALSLGGTNHIGNIELLCPTCNLRKGAKDQIAWAQQNGKLL